MRKIKLLRRELAYDIILSSLFEACLLGADNHGKGMKKGEMVDLFTDTARDLVSLIGYTVPEDLKFEEEFEIIDDGEKKIA